MRSVATSGASVRPWSWATVTEAATFGAFGQYYFGVGSTSDREPGVRDASYLNLLYFLSVNLPNAWQFGFSPTITYDHRASSGNQWNVPVGLMVTKTTLLGKLPVKFNVRSSSTRL